MTIKTIEERLFEQSDMALRVRIEKESEPLAHYFRVGHRTEVEITHGGQPPIKLNSMTCLEALRELAFELHRDSERENHIKEFMEKIKNFSDDYANIQAVIEGGE